MARSARDRRMEARARERSGGAETGSVREAPEVQERPRPWWRDRWLLAVLAVALALRVIVLVSLRRSVYGDFLLWDERTYQTWATALSRGERFGLPDQSALPAYVMAVAYRFFGADPLVARLLNLSYGTLTLVPVYLLGRSLGGRIAGIGSAACAAIYLPFVFFSATVLKEPLGLLLMASTLWLFLACLEAKAFSPRLLFLLGVTAALAVEVRQNALLPLAAMPVLLCVRALRGRWPHRRTAAVAALVIAGYAAGTTPLALARRHHSGGLSPTPVGGFNLYMANYLPTGVPFYRPLPFVTSVPTEIAVQFTIEASRRAGRRLTPGEASSYWTGEVLRTAREQPSAFARKVGLKVLAVFSAWEEADNHSIEYLALHVPALRLPLPGFGLVVSLGMAGLLLLALSDRRVRALSIVLGLYVATMVLVFPQMRVRAPMVLFLVPCAAAAIVRVVERRDRRMAAALLGAALAFAGVSRIPFPGAGDYTAHLNTHAINLAGKGREREAVRYWETSADLRGGYSDFALIALAARRAAAGDHAGARTLLERIPETSFAASSKHELIADTWMASGQAEEARRELERAVGINWGNRSAHAKLLAVLERLDPDRAAAQRRVLEYVVSFYAK